MSIQDFSAFPHVYEARLLPGLPAGEVPNVLNFPSSRGRDGTLVAVCSRGAPDWVGVFAFGGTGLTALFSTPDPRALLVVSRGAGYHVQVGNPPTVTGLRFFPILDARPVPERNLIILVSHTRIAAIGPNGLLWRTQRISWDGISITAIGRQYIEGESWDPKTSVRPGFRVDIDSGEHTGGSHP